MKRYRVPTDDDYRKMVEVRLPNTDEWTTGLLIEVIDEIFYVRYAAGYDDTTAFADCRIEVEPGE